MTHWTFHITLRAGANDEATGIVHGETDVAGMSAMDDWIREHGHPGDHFDWARSGPANIGSGDHGHGVVAES